MLLFAALAPLGYYTWGFLMGLIGQPPRPPQRPPPGATFTSHRDKGTHCHDG